MAFTALTTTSSPRVHFPKTGSLSIGLRMVRYSPAASVSVGFDLKTYRTNLIKEIEQKLDEAAPLQYPQQIHEAMRYSLFTKGTKRSLPVMCIAVCELLGGNRTAAFPTACALEIVHAASLVHKDLPYVDDTQSRRGQLPNHMVYGECMALQTGDALIPLSFRHIVARTPSHLVPTSRLIQIITEITRSMGSTCKFVDLDCTSPNVHDFVQQNKFGELSQCSAVCGGILGGATDDEIEQLRNYGKAVGVLNRMVEDVLEVKEGGEKGKSKSYASVYGVDKALELAKELRSQAMKELEGLENYGDKLLPLYGLLDFDSN